MRVIEKGDLFNGEVVEFVTPERYKEIVEEDTSGSRD